MEWLGFFLFVGLIVVVLTVLLARQITDDQKPGNPGSGTFLSDTARHEHNARVIEGYRNRRLSNSSRSRPHRDTGQSRRRWL